MKQIVILVDRHRTGDVRYLKYVPNRYSFSPRRETTFVLCLRPPFGACGLVQSTVYTVCTEYRVYSVQYRILGGGWETSPDALASSDILQR